MNVERLLNVAKALRESKNPEQFSMARHVNTCGTPACAFGHYAARTDLQNEFSINTAEDSARWPSDGVYFHHDDGGTSACGFDETAVLEHFDLSLADIEMLFGGNGCGYAKTTIEAAKFIERFVAEHGAA
jgi:hypothetical protein